MEIGFNALLSIALGVGLAAATGFRVFLPLLVASLAARSGMLPLSDGFAWLALEPVTGRTHQLRVHTSAMGWPIVGDNIYGNGPRFGEPILHLHSREIVIPISKNKEPVRVTAPAPEHMRERLRKCGWNGE